MKLSEAMLLGSISTPQTFNGIRDSNGGTCALGAVLAGSGRLTEWKRLADTEYIGGSPDWDQFWEEVRIQFPLLSRRVVHPHIGRPIELIDVITLLNDQFGWTRPQIAEYIASLEQTEGMVTIVPQEENVAVG